MVFSKSRISHLLYEKLARLPWVLASLSFMVFGAELLGIISYSDSYKAMVIFLYLVNALLWTKTRFKI